MSKTSTIVITIFMIVLGLTIMFQGITTIMQVAMDHDIQELPTKCIDRLGQEINELNCNKKIGCNYKFEWLNDYRCNDALAVTDVKEKKE